MKQIIITIKRKELIYDIENITHHIANNRLKELDAESKSNVQLSPQEESALAIALREIDHAWGDVQSILRNQLTVIKKTADDTLNMTSTDDFVLNLNEPDSFNEVLTQPATQAIHEFLVNRVIYKWLSLTKPNEASIYLQYAAEAKEKVKNLLASRCGFYLLDEFPKYR